MQTYSYRQPAPGQAFVNLIEGAHQQGLNLDRFVGRYTIVCCFGSTKIAPGQAAVDALRRHERLFYAATANFIGVAIDPAEGALGKPHGGIQFFLDRDGKVSRHCGAAPLETAPLGAQYRVTWTIVDPRLRVLAHFDTSADGAECDAVFAFVKGLPDPALPGPCEVPAPILVLPRVFEPDFCDRLIDLCDKGDARDSGYMVNGVEKFDYSHKRRRDYVITDETVHEILRRRIAQCVNPEIRKLFFMEITRMERYLVGCYTAEDEGHFGPHRDNGQSVTAHRRFAVSVALNDDFDGGELMFPEYNRRRHKTPRGWAIVFPCAILHAVARVTRGRRYVFLPFLFDEEGAKIKARAPA